MHCFSATSEAIPKAQLLNELNVLQSAFHCIHFDDETASSGAEEPLMLVLSAAWPSLNTILISHALDVEVVASVCGIIGAVTKNLMAKSLPLLPHAIQYV